MQLDFEKFWAEDELAHEDRCFSPRARTVALGIRMSDECVFAELGEKGEPWGVTPPERRVELNRRYNDRAEKIVGRRLLSETVPNPRAVFPAYRRIGEVFGGRYVFDGHTEWLEPSCGTPAELERVLDRAEKLDLREFVLPPCWEAEKKRIFEETGLRPPRFYGIRGPVTLATSIMGVENFIYTLYDAPELGDRFSAAIADAIIGYFKIFIEEAGESESSFTHGASFADDNCCLLTPELYERFAAPILSRVFAFASPNPEDRRHQHSDSAMGHIVPILARFNLTSCNFGPTVSVEHIRKYMKTTTIKGCLAPFTFMRNDHAAIRAEVRRDCEQAKASGVRGLELSTAGSINNGSLLRSMRTVMEAICEFGQY